MWEEKGNRYIHWFSAVLLSMVCVAALSVQVVVADISIAQEDLRMVTGESELTEISLSSACPLLTWMTQLHQNFPTGVWGWSVCAAALAYLLYRIRLNRQQRPARGILFLSVLFGIVEVLGLSISSLGSWAFVFKNLYQFFVALLCMAGYSVLFYHATWALRCFLEKERPQVPPIGSGWVSLFCRNPGKASAIVMFVCWVPWLLVFWPGSVDWDSYGQICQMLGSMEMTAHHTVLSTWLHGCFFFLGRFLGSDNLGVFVYVVFHSIICAWAFSRIVHFANKLRCSVSLQLGITAFFALVPVWGAYMQTSVKDTLFTGIFVAFSVRTVDILLFPHEYCGKKKPIIFYLLLAVLCCLLRKNGVYAVFPMLLLSLFFSIKTDLRKLLAAVCLCALIGVTGFDYLTEKVLDIPKGSVSEALSIPFQQTARYVTQYGDEVTGEEKNAINAVLSYDELAKCYDPELSDGVKQFFKNPGREDLLRYFRTWFLMGLKHPVCYVQATHENTYGYYTICKSAPVNEYYMFIYGPSMEWQNLDVYYVDRVGILRYIFIQWVTLFENIPFIGLVTSIGFIAWFVAILGYFLLKHRVKNTYPLLAGLFMLWLTCIASPVNDSLRYFLPIYACMPLVLCLASHFCEKTSQKQG